MKILFSLLILISFFSTQTFASNIDDKQTQDCVIEQLHEQYPQVQRPSYSGIAKKDENNWEVIVTTTFDDGGSDNVFVVVKDADYKNAFLLVPHLTPQKLDLSICFQ